MPLYLVKTTVTQGNDEHAAERLVNAKNTAAARAHVVKDTMTVDVAEPADIHRLAKDGVNIEQASE